MTAPALDRPLCLRRPSLRPWCVRAHLARPILTTVLGRVPVRVTLPDGSALGGAADDPTAPTLRMLRPTALYERMAHHPKIGLGEGYMAGDWDAAPGTDLADALVPFAERLPTLVPPVLARMRRVVDRRIPAATRNTLTGSRANIEAHYDLSNELFAALLDETLSYSSAIFDERRPVAEQTLADAQRAKIEAVLDAADVRAGARVLEIGTGWGSLAIAAARRGAHVTTITLSGEQAELARERIAAAGLADRVEVRLQDYREVTGQFDAIVSVEMIEAVGEEYWPTYFRAIDDLLAPGGVAAIQSILMPHERYLATRRSYGWIQKHIFPGGLIPSTRAIEETTERHTSLRVTSAHHFGQDYAVTLRRLRERFLEQWPTISSAGFDETFRRTWEFYLAYCEAGFAAGYLDVAQIRLEREVLL
ncbi:SAM-dependent methyltransferase [Janibacter hoylei]|uniref:SAM-dependent methyltransferase n=1 Tax=Janibacter hoylei TaxID=364298 RepID=UPI0021A633E7|nr:cyclopropane-fatty-acyl-phospholipid synthase family protein [Janibacter hoylei]MCT1617553.1 cyclopropane-fatty-acyl-phospholipid synthase family protein [Janibacter hoylei]MCT2292178.1 cyclopropane-fatty-acyl-phospholipid synthase family protein [Janibacter hoylei]